MTEIAFVGAGAMGRPLVRRLLEAGHDVLVWNRSPEPVEELVAAGASRAASVEEAFARPVVLSILADDRAVRETVLRPEVLGAGARLHINLATVSVAFAHEAAEAHAAAGVGYVAAPVFGRSTVVEAGKLSVVAAGHPDALDRAQPLLDTIGRRVWRVGDDPAQANLVKIAGNYLIACAIQGLGEAATLAEGHGVDAGGLVEILTDALFPGAVYAGYGAAVAERRYEPAGFTTALGLKDVRLALEAASGIPAPLPFGGVLQDAFLDALAHGQASQDWASVAETQRRRAGLA